MSALPTLQPPLGDLQLACRVGGGAVGAGAGAEEAAGGGGGRGRGS